MALAMYHPNTSQGQEEDGLGEHVEVKSTPSSTSKSERRLVRQGSVSENFFAVNNAALILPKKSNGSEKIEGKRSLKFGGDLKTHLHAIFHLLRPQDTVKLVARLESWEKKRNRYLVVVTTNGRQDTEENIILGIDFRKDENKNCTIGLVIPIWNDTSIKLDGDGGLKVTGRDKTYIFKPVSVQAMWSALQAVHKCIEIAYYHNYYYGSLYLTWICYYESRVTSPRLFLNEWEHTDDLWSRKPNYFAEKDPVRESTELKIRGKLKEVMMQMDLDNCNSRDVRQALEKVIDHDLKEYKTYVDTEMLTILAQMDTASKILDFLYLGSEWNASNMEELDGIGITHILNITMEIDNFFPDDFVYKNIRCYDIETADLLHLWNDTWKFIKQARRANGKCLVHCKMGISRSAATVTAFIMKENLWPMEKALSYVKERRPIVHPNSGFMQQLQEYEGILKASSQRHNLLFRSYSESNLSAEHGTSEKESRKESLVSDNTTFQTQMPVDFNRRLLDLTYRHPHKRSKSWSPGEEGQCYNDITSESYYEDSSAMNRSHMSEPQDLFSPNSSKSEPNQPLNGASSAANKRKKWTRRHTERIFIMHNFDSDSKTLAQSEDSVFVNPGVVPARREDVWVAPSSESNKYKRPERMSSPAAVQTTKIELEVQEIIHSSLASPMNSPSFKSTKNVNVALLKTQFTDEQLLTIECPAKELTPDQTEQSVVLCDNLTENCEEIADTSKMALCEDIASETTEPSITTPSSDDMPRVRSLVGDIESRFIKQSREGMKESSENCKHCANATSPTTLPPSNPSQESSLPSDIGNNLSSRADENNSNVNNSNNIHIHVDSQLHKTYHIEDSSDAKNIMSRSASSTLGYSKREGTHHKLLSTRTLTQNELQVIREVGKTFLAKTDSVDHPIPPPRASPPKADSFDDQKESPVFKKRGIVRRMARIIEDRIKRQPQEEKSHNKQSKKNINQYEAARPVSEVPVSTSPKTDVFSPCQYTDDTSESYFKNHSARPVRDTVFSVSKSQNDPEKVASRDAGRLQVVRHRSVSPAPATREKRAFMFYKARLAVRRSQSERRFAHTTKSFFPVLRKTHYSQSDVHPDPSNRVRGDGEDAPEVRSCSGVKKIVKMMEASNVSSKEEAIGDSKPHFRPNCRGRCYYCDADSGKVACAKCGRRICINYISSDEVPFRNRGGHAECSGFHRDNYHYQTI